MSKWNHDRSESLSAFRVHTFIEDASANKPLLIFFDEVGRPKAYDTAYY